MRASMSSASGCENVSNVRTAGPPGFTKVLVIWKPTLGASPKNIRSTVTCAASRQLCPEGHSGYGAVRSAVQVASGSVAAFPSSNARGIAFHGRQKSKWYLSFQQLIAASAPLRFCSARSLALSAASRSFRAMSCRATSFQLRIGCALPPPGHVRLLVSPGRAGGSAQALDLVELSRPLRAVERGRWRSCGTARSSG